MTYELAKELKDAGFPQLGDGFALVPHDPTLAETPEEETMSVIPWCQYVYRPTSKFGETLYAPTLSELIEACGHLRLEAFTDTGHFYTNCCDRKAHEQVGSTSEEAVARLWLALNTKA